MRLAPLALALLAPAAAWADTAELTLTIKDHRFEPATLAVPAGQKFRLKVVNADAGAEEFESHELNREKVIPGNSSGIVFIGPLDPGEYPFFGDFHQETAQGKLVAK